MSKIDASLNPGCPKESLAASRHRIGLLELTEGVGEPNLIGQEAAQATLQL
jgi:hypothetical protein